MRLCDLALVFSFGGNMKKRFLAMALATLTVSALAGCSMKSPEMTSTTAAAAGESTDAKADSKADNKSDGAEVTLVYAEVNPLDTIVGQSGTAFKEKVEELSGGKIHIDIQASGVLGSENDVLDGMLGGTGTVDMSRISAFALTSYGAKKASLLSMPYTFNSREHFWKFVDSDLSKEFLQETSDLKLGIKSLYYGEEGFRHFFTKSPVTKVEDLKGMKLRVSNDPIMNGMVEGLGASPTVVAFNENNMNHFKRVLLKLSGESLMGAKQYGIDNERLAAYAQDIQVAVQRGIQVAIVIGGGNIFRGLSGAAQGFDRVQGDQMGMLATVINSLALGSALTSLGVKNRVLTAIRMEPIGEFYSKRRAVDALEAGEVVILSGGTGNPFFTTDTGSSLRGIELDADVMLKGTRVDGIYTADPEKDPTATKFDRITYDEIYKRGLKVMDLTATTMCMENNLPIIVFDMDTPGNLLKVLSGEPIGTYVGF